MPVPTDKLVDEAIFASDRGTYYRDFGKRSFDVVLVLIAALPVLLILVILGFLVALDGKSPFYIQKRVGRNGRIFRMVKLRSMVFNAEERLREFLDQNPQASVMWERDQKLQDDPRVTAIGRFIRKTSLDELPQLWNVLIGDMSLVGPPRHYWLLADFGAQRIVLRGAGRVRLRLLEETVAEDRSRGTVQDRWRCSERHRLLSSSLRQPRLRFSGPAGYTSATRNPERCVLKHHADVPLGGGELRR